MKLNAQILAAFQEGFDAAKAGGVLDATAMIVSTRHEDGEGVSARTVLLKAVDEQGFVFYTNTLSNKGRQLSAYPVACLVFPWLEIERQVIVEGRVEAVSDAEADAYFASRPRGSQIGAWASQQSSRLNQRSDFEQAIQDVEARFADTDVPRPPHWSGYRVVPNMVEFWYGRAHRLHDRHRWTLKQGEWQETLLYP